MIFDLESYIHFTNDNITSIYQPFSVDNLVDRSQCLPYLILTRFYISAASYLFLGRKGRNPIASYVFRSRIRLTYAHIDCLEGGKKKKGRNTKNVRR